MKMECIRVLKRSNGWEVVADQPLRLLPCQASAIEYAVSRHQQNARLGRLSAITVSTSDRSNA